MGHEEVGKALMPVSGVRNLVCVYSSLNCLFISTHPVPSSASAEPQVILGTQKNPKETSPGPRFWELLIWRRQNQTETL